MQSLYSVSGYARAEEMEWSAGRGRVLSWFSAVRWRGGSTGTVELTATLLLQILLRYEWSCWCITNAVHSCSEALGSNFSRDIFVSWPLSRVLSYRFFPVSQRATQRYMVQILWRPQTNPWIWALLQALQSAQLLKNRPIFYGTRRLIAVFIRDRHWSLSWARWIHYIAWTPRPLARKRNIPTERPPLVGEN
jgi:hypothetical protein